jgi:hypothetical protein
MNLDDMTPAGGGSLRGQAEPAVSSPVGTFTPTQAVHPDTIWSPRGSELAPTDRPLTSRDAYPGAESERPATLSYMAADLHRTVRAALRPGLAG